MTTFGASGIWPDSPQKVVCVTQRWHEQHPATHLRLRLAVMEACAWLDDPEHREVAAGLLASPDYLDVSKSWLLPSLRGRLRMEPRGAAATRADCHRFGAGMDGFPWRCELAPSRSWRQPAPPPADRTATVHGHGRRPTVGHHRLR